MGDEEESRRFLVTNLMGDVGSCIADVSVHLSHHTNMLIAIQQRVLVLLHTIASHTMRGLVCLKACIRQHDDQSLGVFVAAGDGHMLLGHQLWRLGGGSDCVCVPARPRATTMSAMATSLLKGDAIAVRVQVFSASRCEGKRPVEVRCRVAEPLDADHHAGAGKLRNSDTGGREIFAKSVARLSRVR